VVDEESTQNPLCEQSPRLVTTNQDWEMRVGDTSTLLATEVTAEQKEILGGLGVPPQPAAFSWKFSVQTGWLKKFHIND